VAYAARDAQAIGQAFGVSVPADVEVAVPIWTTTPWTLPASLAVSLGAEINYVLAEGPAHNGKRRWLVLAAALAERALQRYGVDEVVLHGETTGAALENQLLAHPFYPEREILVLNGDHVSDEDGTGAVHTAPATARKTSWSARSTACWTSTTPARSPDRRPWRVPGIDPAGR
jgi:isoleucyl-tRNA synthetase